MNRRHFISASVVGLAAALAFDARPVVGSAVATDVPRRRLLMPPLLDATESGRVVLTAQPGLSNFLGGRATLTAGYNQPYLGPTIRVRNGPLAARLGNRLQEPVSVHWHGLLVPGEHDGGPHSAVLPGRTWDVDMQLAQRPATLWYHSHVHGRTAPHVYSGLAGALHFSDGRDDQRGLPSAYGVDDLTLIIQDRRFDDSGRMIYSPSMTDVLNGFQGTHILVNGQHNPIAAVPRGIVRLRIINGSNSRFYSLNMDDGRPMFLVGTDGGLLSSPAEIRYLRMAPGERTEVLVDFAEGPAPTLMSNRGLSQRILEFALDETRTPRITRLPGELGAEDLDVLATPVRTRRFGLNLGGSSAVAAIGVQLGGGLVGASAMAAHDHAAMGHAVGDFGINGRPHDMARIDEKVPLGAVERWVIGGGGAGVEHPFHVHGVHFRVGEEGGGAAPRLENRGWKDTVVVSGNTELIVRFDYPADVDHPYMYHCHILEHEDAGMMGQFTVS